MILITSAAYISNELRIEFGVSLHVYYPLVIVLY